MGGFGSGKIRLYSVNGKKKGKARTKFFTTELPCLHIDELIKLDKKNPSSTFTFNKVRLEVKDSFIAVSRLDGEHFVTNQIKISEKPCHYGGSRYYGICPVCKKNFKDLYLTNGGFGCRKCFN